MTSRPTPSTPCLRVLVSGAAGLIGGDLCGRLAQRGHRVVALLHRSRSIVRNDGEAVAAHPLRPGGPPAGAVAWLDGSVLAPRLGFDAASAAGLARWSDVIVHCAAVTGFTESADAHRAVNVEGTANVLRFIGDAGAAAPGLVHVSTAYVCGLRSGTIAETDLDVGQAFANAYEATKAEAEALVTASGLRAAVARPSIVVGASDTGAIARFENFYGLIKLIGSGHIRSLPAAPGATLDLVPIDHVVGGLVDIVERFDAAAGQRFHLASGDPAPLTALAAPVYHGFHVPELVSPDSFDPLRLAPGERSIYRRTTSLYASYLQRDPRFSTHGLEALSGRTCPASGTALLQRAVAFAVGAGYLRPAPDLMERTAFT